MHVLAHAISDLSSLIVVIKYIDDAFLKPSAALKWPLLRDRIRGSIVCVRIISKSWRYLRSQGTYAIPRSVVRRFP